MEENLLIQLITILVFGGLAQWIGWRIRLPSILLLLLIGIIAGAVTGFIDPEELFGSLFFPLVSFSVALIMFEGGLTLRFSELQEVWKPLRRLISAGALITWAVTTAAAYYLLDLPFRVALLLGAILIVSGPTVVQPLLVTVRPTPRVASLLKWEGITIDSVGATIAVLVLEAIVSGELNNAAGFIALGILETLLVGGLLGFIGAAVLIGLLRYYLLPDFLQNPAALTLVLVVFTVSNLLQPESGLVAVTLMGILLANQSFVPVRHIVEFKENLRVLLLSGLFILLAARLNMADLRAELTSAGGVFLAVVFFLARPLTVLVTTLGSRFNWRERAFIAWMAPRGIVAASVSALFSFQLSALEIAGAERLVPITFLVIIASVLLYGLTASPVARLLGVAIPAPQGVLIVGAHAWARNLAQALKAHKVQVLLVDTNLHNIHAAQQEDLAVYHGSILADDFFEDVSLEGLGKMMALTANDEVNSLASIRLSEVFGRVNVYHLPLDGEVTHHLRGRTLFSQAATFRALSQRFSQDAYLASIPLTDRISITDFRTQYGHQSTPLFLVNDSDSRGSVRFFTAEEQVTPRPGDVLISLVNAGVDLSANPERSARAASD
ncbi:MAG TPA: cation:proton antiporter [Anaerolineaceae bacterium]|nr:cation:proton antiporter [Anaerolineaceae bacterium]